MVVIILTSLCHGFQNLKGFDFLSTEIYTTAVHNKTLPLKLALFKIQDHQTYSHPHAVYHIFRLDIQYLLCIIN